MKREAKLQPAGKDGEPAAAVDPAVTIEGQE